MSGTKLILNPKIDVGIKKLQLKISIKKDDFELFTPNKLYYTKMWNQYFVSGSFEGSILPLKSNTDYKHKKLAR